MNCDRCEQPTGIEIAERYHYTSCGLNNVYLLNVEVRVCPNCGARPRLARISDLLARIGRTVALRQVALKGADIRFLRKQLGVAALEWARKCKVDVATLSRCENDQQRLGPQTDLLMRYVYIRSLEEATGYRVTDAFVDRLGSVEGAPKESAPILIDMRQNEAEYLMSFVASVQDTDSERSSDFSGRVLFALKSPRREISQIASALEEHTPRLPDSKSALLEFSEDKPKYAAITLAA